MCSRVVQVQVETISWLNLATKNKQLLSKIENSKTELDFYMYYTFFENTFHVLRWLSKIGLGTKIGRRQPEYWSILPVQSILRKPGCEAIDFAGISLKQI